VIVQQSALNHSFLSLPPSLNLRCPCFPREQEGALPPAVIGAAVYASVFVREWLSSSPPLTIRFSLFLPPSTFPNFLSLNLSLSQQQPFQIHAGWILAASNVNLSVLFVAYGAGDNYATQLSVAVLTFAFVILATCFCLFSVSNRFVVVAGVQAWALTGIAAELDSPFAKIEAAFGPIVLAGLSGAASSAASAIWTAVAIATFCEIYVALAEKPVEGKRGESSEAPLM